jgi:hypothetical protein
VTRTTTSRRLGALTEIVGDDPARAVLPPSARIYSAAGGCSVIVSRDAGRWHVSISHRHRYPTWDEIADARYALVPDDVTMAMLLPPSSEYVNAHDFCFHLWEIDDPREIG